MGLFDVNTSNTENIQKTEDTVINSLYQIMQSTISSNVSNKCTYDSSQNNTGTIAANGIGSSISNLIFDQKNSLNTKTRLYVDLNTYIDTSVENNSSLSSAMQTIKEQVAEAIQKDESLLNIANVQTTNTTNDDETYFQTIQSSVQQYLDNVSYKIDQNPDLNFNQSNDQKIYAVNGGQITNVVINQFNDEEAQFESEVRNAYDKQVQSANDQSTKNIQQSDSIQSSSATTESEGSEYLMIVIIIVCVIVAIIIIAVVCACVKNPEGVKAVGKAATDVASVATPAGAAASAVSSIVGGLKQISRQGAIAIVVVLSIVIVIGIFLVIDGAVGYVVNDCLLTETARNLKIMSNNKLYQQNPGAYSQYSTDQLHDEFEKEYNTGNIIELSIGSILVIGGTIAVCVCGDLWKKQGIL